MCCCLYFLASMYLIHLINQCQAPFDIFSVKSATQTHFAWYENSNMLEMINAFLWEYQCVESRLNKRNHITRSIFQTKSNRSRPFRYKAGEWGKSSLYSGKSIKQTRNTLEEWFSAGRFSFACLRKLNLNYSKAGKKSLDRIHRVRIRCCVNLGACVWYAWQSLD